MNDKEKSQLIAEAENIEAIRDFFNYWYSVEQLYETLAKSCITILHMANRSDLPEEDKKQFEELLNQHEMMIDLIKPLQERRVKYDTRGNERASYTSRFASLHTNDLRLYQREW